MLHSTENVIRHKIGLLNLAEELDNVSKACKIMGVSRDTLAENSDGSRYRVLRPARAARLPVIPGDQRH